MAENKAAGSSVRKRAGLPKTRTGCRTCKTRKVKCDEGKPACLRCIKFGIECEGYNSPPESRLARSKFSTLLPKTSETTTLKRFHMVQAAPSFDDGQEYRCFSYFQDETVHSICGTHDPNLWMHLIIQTSRYDVPLRRLVSSLGALTRFKKLQLHNDPNDSGNELLQYSFQQYGRALKGIQQNISLRQDSFEARKALIAAILIYCFEIMNGAASAAVAHMRNAVAMMERQFASSTEQYDHVHAAGSYQPLEHDLMAAMVRANANIATKMPTSPEEAAVEVEPARNLQVDFKNETFHMPAKFTTIMEARKSIENIQYWALPELIPEFKTELTRSSDILPERARHQCETIVSQIQEWTAAFDSFVEDIHAPAGSRLLQAVTISRVQSMGMRLVAHRLLARGSVPPSSLTSDSKEILRLASTIVSDPNFNRGFIFECEIIPSLFLVATMCLDMSLRQEALHMLRGTMPRQEGCWDSATMVMIAEQVMGAGQPSVEC